MGWDEALLDLAAGVRLKRAPGQSESSIHKSAHHPPPAPNWDGVAGGHESVQYGWEAGRTDLIGYLLTVARLRYVKIPAAPLEQGIFR